MRAVVAAAVGVGLVLSQAAAPSAQAALDDACKARIGARFREWTMASVSAAVAERARARGAAKGARYHDIERDHRDVYPSDGVTTICFKQASATYLYDGAGFRRIVDGD